MLSAGRLPLKQTRPEVTAVLQVRQQRGLKLCPSLDTFKIVCWSAWPEVSHHMSSHGQRAREVKESEWKIRVIKIFWILINITNSLK